jgi:hypothetical protein
VVFWVTELCSTVYDYYRGIPALFFTLMMEAVYFSETLITTCHSIPCHNLVDHNKKPIMFLSVYCYMK